MKEFFNKYLDNDCTEEDFKSVVELFTNPENQQVLDENMKEGWENDPASHVPDLSDVLHKIHYEINKMEQLRPKHRKLLTYVTRIAAVLLIPFAAAWFFQIHKDFQQEEALQTISTPLASKTSFKLPDGSIVWLNAGSSISFPFNFECDTRLVKLTGEAYFDVKKSDRPFEVETSYFTVNVLGTAFNVMAYDDELPEITLEHGAVIIEAGANNKVTLAPGQQAVIDTLTRAITKREVDTGLYSAWVHNKLIFKNETLEKAVNRLERWYNIDIYITDRSLMEIPMTATIEYESIGEVMDLMEITMPVKYEYRKNNRQLIISKK